MTSLGSPALCGNLIHVSSLRNQGLIAPNADTLYSYPTHPFSLQQQSYQYEGSYIVTFSSFGMTGPHQISAESHLSGDAKHLNVCMGAAKCTCSYNVNVDSIWSYCQRTLTLMFSIILWIKITAVRLERDLDYRKQMTSLYDPEHHLLWKSKRPEQGQEWQGQGGRQG